MPAGKGLSNSKPLSKSLMACGNAPRDMAWVPARRRYSMALDWLPLREK